MQTIDGCMYDVHCTMHMLGWDLVVFEKCRMRNTLVACKLKPHANHGAMQTLGAC